MCSSGFNKGKIMTLNELVAKISDHLEYLGNLKMKQLRETAGYGCSTAHEAREMNAQENRGQLLAMIILEEYSEESDREIED